MGGNRQGLGVCAKSTLEDSGLIVVYGMTFGYGMKVECRTSIYFFKGYMVRWAVFLFPSVFQDSIFYPPACLPTIISRSVFADVHRCDCPGPVSPEGIWFL